MTKTPTHALIRDSGLTTTAKAILWALDARHGKDGAIFPSLSKLALDTSMDRSNVKHWVHALRETSVLTVLSGTKGRSNRYSINLDELLSADERMALRGGGASAPNVGAIRAVDSSGSAPLRIKEESILRTKGNIDMSTPEGMDSPPAGNAKGPDSDSTIEGMMERASAVLTKLWGQPPTEKQLGRLAKWAEAHSPQWVLDTLEARPKGSNTFQYMEDQHRASEGAIREVREAESRQADLPVVQRLSEIWGRPPTKNELRSVKGMYGLYGSNGMAQVVDDLGDMSPADDVTVFLWGKYAEYRAAGESRRVAWLEEQQITQGTDLK